MNVATRISSSVAGLLALALLAPPPAAAQTLPPGIDCWRTLVGSTVGLPVLPLGFFGTKNGVPSDARPEETIDVEGNSDDPPECPCAVDLELLWNEIHGSTVDPNTGHSVDQVRDVALTHDACVERPDSVELPQGPSDFVNVPIKMHALALRSVDPITVTYGDGTPSEQDPSDFDVFIELNNSEVDQDTGNLQLQGDGLAFLGNLPVEFKHIFEEVNGNELTPIRGSVTPRGGDPQPIFAAQSTTGSISFSGTTGDWSFIGAPQVSVLEIPTLSGWSRALLALLLVVAAMGTLLLLRQRLL